MGYLPELVDSVILPGFDEHEMSVAIVILRSSSPSSVATTRDPKPTMKGEDHVTEPGRSLSSKCTGSAHIDIAETTENVR